MRSARWFRPACPASPSFSPILWRKSQRLTSRACLHFLAKQPPLGQCPASPSTQEKMPSVTRTLNLKTPRKQRPWGRGFVGKIMAPAARKSGTGRLAASLTLSMSPLPTARQTRVRHRAQGPHTWGPQASHSVLSAPCSPSLPMTHYGVFHPEVNLGAFSVALG